MGWRGGVNGEVVLCTGELGPGCKQRAREGGRRVSHAEGRDARGERVRARGARVCAAHTPARRRVRAPLCVRVRARARPRARALHARARATRPRAFTRACVHTRVRSGVQVPAGVRMRGRSPPPPPFPAWVRRGARGRSILLRGSGSAALPFWVAPLRVAACSLRRRRRRSHDRVQRLRFRSCLAAAVPDTMNKKKKPFLGMPAPLGYVPGLGRG